MVFKFGKKRGFLKEKNSKTQKCTTMSENQFFPQIENSAYYDSTDCKIDKNVYNNNVWIYVSEYNETTQCITF